MNIRSAILRATDAKLRTDNWQFILDVCDLVREDPEDGGSEAMEIIEQRLEQNDANVILRTLALITSLAENCGSRLKQLISSKHFTGILYDLMESRSVHITVKREIAKVVRQLSSSFKEDPSLRYMNDLFVKLSSKSPHLLEVDQPNVPSKQEMSMESKTKEDKDLEEALKLSLVEYGQHEQQPQREIHPQSEYIEAPTQQQPPQQQPSEAPTVVKKVRAMYDLSTTEQDELSFKKGDIIIVLEQVYRDWWRGTLHGKVGIFPLNYVTPVKEPSIQELQSEKEKENELFAQKTNVDQLYYTLQNAKNSTQDDLTQSPAVNDLYGNVTPLRPQVARMIGKYARKREDLTSLRQVLANAEATYNQLLDRATSAYTSPVPQPSASIYGQGQFYHNYPQKTNLAQNPQPERYEQPSSQQPNFPNPPSYGNGYGQTRSQSYAPPIAPRNGSRTQYSIYDNPSEHRGI